MANSNRTLSDGEQKYRMLFNSIDAGFCVIEVLFDTNAKAVDFRFLETNPAFERQTGIAEAAGKTAREVLPNFGSGLLDLYGKIARTGIPARFDSFSEVLGRFYDVYAFRTGDPGEGKIAVLFNDISERKRTEQALQESEKRYRELVQNANSAILRWKCDGTITFFNEYAQSLFGYTAAEIVGRHVEILLPEVDSTGGDISLLARDIVQRPEAYVRSVNENICRDGRRVWMVWTNKAVLDQAGNFAEILAVGVDITERVKAEHVVRASEARFRSIYDSNLIGVVFADSVTGEVFDANDEYLRIIGRSRDELLQGGVNWKQATLPEDLPHEEALAYGRKGGERVELFEKTYVRPDGTRVPVVLGGSVMPDDPQKVVAVVMDITQRIQTEEALRNLNATLEQRVEVRTAEVKQLADQLRAVATELSVTEQRERKRMAGILHDHVQQLLVAAQIQLSLVKHVETDEIEPAVERVESIIEEAIQASRSLTVELSPPVLHQAGLAAALAWLAVRMREQNLFTVHIEAEREDDPASEMVRLLLFESVRELLLNAVKHSGASEAWVTMTREPEGGTKVTIEDRGIGFDPGMLKSHRSGSFGIFSIQQRLAYLGGRVEVESAVGKGTRIILYAPSEVAQDQAADNAVIAEAGTVAALPGAHRNITVLLADDHRIMRQGLVSLLQFQPDMQVVGEAENGIQAVELARKLHPDVVIMDIGMPEMGGIEATRIIVKEMPAVKVVGLSMHVEKDVAGAMQEAGAAGFVTKGGRAEDLLCSIRSCFATTPEPASEDEI